MYSTLTSLQRKRYLFVCINRRAEENPKGCCAAKDSEEVYRALKGEVAARGLAKLEARVCTSSCLDQCATGVTVLVEPDHFFYGRVTVADVPEIVDGLVKGQPVKSCSVGLKLARSTRFKQDKSLLPMHHKPLTMHELNSCSGGCVSRKNTVAACR